jgi:hypothetical protein
MKMPGKMPYKTGKAHYEMRWRPQDNVITQERFDRLVAGGMHTASYPCPTCGKLTTKDRRTRTCQARPDLTDKRCYMCVELPKEQAWLKAECAKSKAARLAAREVKKREAAEEGARLYGIREAIRIKLGSKRRAYAKAAGL